MRSIKQITKVVDDFIADLEEAYTLDCRGRIIWNRERDFAIVISNKGKKYVTTPRYGGISFDGIILDKYNTNVYTLLNCLKELELLTEEEVIKFGDFLRGWHREQDKSSKLQQAREMLEINGFEVRKK